MRIVVFLGLLFIANAINPQEINMLDKQSQIFISILCLWAMFADILDFLKNHSNEK